MGLAYLVIIVYNEDGLYKELRRGGDEKKTHFYFFIDYVDRLKPFDTAFIWLVFVGFMV